MASSSFLVGLVRPFRVACGSVKSKVKQMVVGVGDLDLNTWRVVDTERLLAEWCFKGLFTAARGVHRYTPEAARLDRYKLPSFPFAVFPRHCISLAGCGGEGRKRYFFCVVDRDFDRPIFFNGNAIDFFIKIIEP